MNTATETPSIEDLKTSIAGLPRPRVKLSGQNSNAFVLLGVTVGALRKAGWTTEQVESFCNVAKSGDYDNLLHVCMTYADVR